ncbi:MAG: hypothetical protein DWH82_05755 [Planctomycetota bacterium]|nr:MAG: hypothetical protein DWH82_05755 [Planctomycetota bacterium]
MVSHDKPAQQNQSTEILGHLGLWNPQPSSGLPHWTEAWLKLNALASLFYSPAGRRIVLACPACGDQGN